MSISLKLAPVLVLLASGGAAGQTITHVWEVPEIEFRAAQPYRNPYTEVLCWVDLNGPAFSGRVYAFWDGGDVFRPHCGDGARKVELGEWFEPTRGQGA
jgi:hypothetical protein